MFTNPTFELEGAKRGTALAWHLITHASGEELAGFRENDFATVPVDLSVGTDWTQDGATVLGGATDPGGGSTAYQITELPGLTVHGLFATEMRTCSSGRPMTFGVWIKANTNGYAFIGYATGFGGAGVFVDLVSSKIVGTVQPLDAIERLGAQLVIFENGWVLIECTITPVGASQPINPVILMSRDGVNYEYDDGGLGRSIFAWCPYLYDGTAREHEDFERAWDNDAYSVQLPVELIELASFATSFVTPESFESFESGWSNFPYLDAIASAEAVAPETFESAWDNSGYLVTFLPIHVASIAGDAFYWTTLETTIDPGDLDPMLNSYDNGEEHFGPIVHDTTITADPATNRFNGYGLEVSDGMRVQILNVSGQMPGGVYSTLVYYVASKTSTSFKIAETYGGAEVDITSRETGSLIVRMVPEAGWNGPMILA